MDEKWCTWALDGTGGGATENRARSCDSVSRIRAVMSCGASRALVKGLGGGKCRSAMDEEQRAICSRCNDNREEDMASLLLRQATAISGLDTSRLTQSFARSLLVAVVDSLWTRRAIRPHADEAERKHFILALWSWQTYAGDYSAGFRRRRVAVASFRHCVVRSLGASQRKLQTPSSTIHPLCICISSITPFITPRFSIS